MRSQQIHLAVTTFILILVVLQGRLIIGTLRDLARIQEKVFELQVDMIDGPFKKKSREDLRIKTYLASQSLPTNSIADDVIFFTNAPVEDRGFEIKTDEIKAIIEWWRKNTNTNTK